MARNREYIEWGSTLDGNPDNQRRSENPFDDPVVRERMIQIIVRAAAGPKKLLRPLAAPQP
jgi:hypothetical protein